MSTKKINRAITIAWQRYENIGLQLKKDNLIDFSDEGLRANPEIKKKVQHILLRTEYDGAFKENFDVPPVKYSRRGGKAIAKKDLEIEDNALINCLGIASGFFTIHSTKAVNPFVFTYQPATIGKSSSIIRKPEFVNKYGCTGSQS